MVAWDGRTEVERLSKMLKNLQDQITALQAAPLRLPFVDADPTTAYPGNWWAFNDNKIHLRKPDGTIREIITTAPASTTTGTPLPPPAAQVTTHVSTYSASFTQTYQGDGDQRNENTLHVGYGSDSFNGRQTALIGFPYATIASNLSGASITKVELYLYCTHTWWKSGASLAVGAQTNTSAPGSLGGVTHVGISGVTVKGTDVGAGQGFHSVSTSLGAYLRDGSSTGIALTAPSNDASHYAILGGVSSGLPVPQLRITYRK